MAEGFLRIERFLVDGLRAGRSFGYRLLDPADRFLRILARKPALPPIFLRRHAGPVRAFETSTQDLFALLSRRGLLKVGMTVLDMGCGPGAVPLRLEQDGPALRRYVGFDVNEPSIAWCRRRFRDNPAFQFAIVPARTSDWRFPLPDGGADLVLAKSLFTHLMEETLRRYLAEMRRCLSETGRGVLTAFVFDGSMPSPPVFPHYSEDPRIRWRRRARPEAAVAYERGLFEKMLSGAGLKIEEMIPGFWPGASSRLTGQDTYIVRRGP